MCDLNWRNKERYMLELPGGEKDGAEVELKREERRWDQHILPSVFPAYKSQSSLIGLIEFKAKTPSVNSYSLCMRLMV